MLLEMSETATEGETEASVWLDLLVERSLQDVKCPDLFRWQFLSYSMSRQTQTPTHLIVITTHPISTHNNCLMDPRPRGDQKGHDEEVASVEVLSLSWKASQGQVRVIS